MTFTVNTESYDANVSLVGNFFSPTKSGPVFGVVVVVVVEVESPPLFFRSTAPFPVAAAAAGANSWGVAAGVVVGVGLARFVGGTRPPLSSAAAATVVVFGDGSSFCCCCCFCCWSAPFLSSASFWKTRLRIDHIILLCKFISLTIGDMKILVSIP